jgi:thiamine-monophosphate kinase
MSEEISRTEISDLGEFRLIEKITADLPKRVSSTKIGVGDDAAVIDRGNDVLEVLTTDMLVEGIHFDMSYMPLKHLGYKAIAVNVSDVAAMNAIPEHVTVSIAISNRFSVEAIEELYEGMKIACETYGVDLIGGDTTSSLSGLVVSVTALGTTTKEKLALRSGAKPGDVICVTGDLGAAYLGLQVLEREKQVFMVDSEMTPKLDENEYQVLRLLKPEARMDVVHAFADHGFVPSSMIDISDGLASELFHIATKSGVGVEIWDEPVPIDNSTYELAVQFNIDPATCALNGGEDYELLFTCSESEYEKIKKMQDITAIGSVKKKEEGLKFITKKGNVFDLEAQGWDHFKTS